FKFYTWDYENTVGNNRARSPLTKNALGNDFGSTDTSRPSYANTGQPHTYLRTNPEYRLLFADSAHRHLFHGGVLTPESLIPRYAELADNVERAIVGESARWGDQHYNPPLTLAEWYAERDWILGTYLPQRSDIVLGQFRAAGLYPAVDAPEFSRHGGRIEAGFRLTMTAPGGVVYYTLDGTDPRLPGGTVSPGAIPASDVAPIVLMAGGGMARAHVPADGSLGLDWTLPGFDDSTWREGTMGVGFDAGTGYEDHIALDLEDIMHEVNSAAYIRIPFTLDPALFDGGSPALILLNLLIQYDDGFIAYINGTRVKAVNAPEIAEWNSHATLSHSDALAVQFERVALEDAVSLLEPGENLLAIHGLNVTSTNSDFLISAGLEAVPASEGIALEHSILVQARALDGTEWSALNSATFVVDIPLRITEIMYHPAPPPEGSLFDESHFEFIELQNVGDEAIELADLWLDDGIWFDFAESPVTRLLPGRILVLVKNAEAFASRYGAAGILVGGEYGGKLDNRGDRVILRGPYGEALLEIDYGDDWEPETDGMGPSLVIVDPHGDPDAWGDPSSWRASSFAFGSPGVDESSPEPMGWQLPGDLNQDGELNISDPVALLAHLFLGRARVLPCDDGSSLLSPGNLSLLDSNGDAGVDLSDAVHLLGFLFLGGPVPARGAQCTVIPGCPDVCR
ncbi:MAG: hypothetical protein JXA90_12065, partial [Planctomycetes bacterium]|nr:hypothetical protein [Planctomycetota bacterium]